MNIQIWRTSKAPVSIREQHQRALLDTKKYSNASAPVKVRVLYKDITFSCANYIHPRLLQSNIVFVRIKSNHRANTWPAHEELLVNFQIINKTKPVLHFAQGSFNARSNKDSRRLGSIDSSKIIG